MPGEWHNRMEEFFPIDMREIKFYCSSKVSNTCRRSDILLNDNRTCEIQHSYISENEIIDRFNDWNKFGKTIIWLVDGNGGVELDKLSTGNYLLIFQQLWKYKSFMKIYDYILLEKGDMVFKIELKKIKSGMIELKGSKTLEETIHILKENPNEIWDFWEDDNVVKSTLSVHQQGAGNGKTYGIWKSITENTDRKTYIIVTKQHSAKTVIYEELNDQRKRFETSEGKEAYHIENITSDSKENTEKHYVIKYTHKQSKRGCTVIIGTIDSFCCNLSHSNAKGSKFFEGIVENMKDNGATKINNGYMKFGGQSIQLSKESEIWIDEVQDLPENYLHAMIKLMYETQCYMNVVGDKLQSLEFKNNFLTGIVDEGLPNINIDKKEAVNKNRRIKVTNMADEINKIINFDNFNYNDKPLPKIECDEDIQKDMNEGPIKLIETPIIYSNDTDDDKINNYCDKIMENYIYEVENNNYSPNDFLIIFPIMKNNVIASELQSKVQGYWLDKEEGCNGEYTQYVHLHKHTEGCVINTKDSINSTRIMSVRSSKGDGRKVTFILGITESSLKVVSNKEKCLVYESYLHVALTRAKNQIYFGLVKNNDDIHQRFSEAGFVEYLPNINKKVSLDKICELINKDELIKLFNENDIYMIEKEKNIMQTETVDWGYHCIKHQTYYYQVILNIVADKDIMDDEIKDQLFVKLRIISKLTLERYNVKGFWKFLKEYQYKKIPHFPVCYFSDKPEYHKYYLKIKKTILKVQSAIRSNTLAKLNVYESIILTYMIQIEISQKYADMTPMDIYNITDFFEKDMNKEQQLLNNIQNIKDIITKSGFKQFKNVKWNILKHIELDSKKDYFKISKLQFPIIGNNETDIIHIVLKSDISQLNYWDTMIEILLERFLIYNPKSKEDNEKFRDKKINTFLFVLDKNNFKIIDWEWDKGLTKEIKTELNKTLKMHFEQYHNDIYKYLYYMRKQKIDTWDTENELIIDNIIPKCEEMYACPDYIIQFFKDIETKIEEDEDYSYINSFNTFNRKLNKKLESYLNKYLK